MAFSLCSLLLAYLICGSVTGAESNNGQVRFAHQWAVKMDGDLQQCRRLADDHVLDCIGPIGSLENVYWIRSKKISKRRARNITENIQKDPRVISVQPQHFLQRFKRQQAQRSEPLYFTDPLYDKQWYIIGGSKNGHTLNVMQAWRRSYTGKGVIVAVLDDGIQHTHPDLLENYDPKASTDLMDQDRDPTPEANSQDNHGTKCAGVIAAVANNSHCTVGLAYNAKVGGLRLPLANTTDAIEASALGFNNQYIHIYSSSWGPADNGKVVEGPGELVHNVLLDGVTKGRGGLGSIYVWASGNGGIFDSCSCDGYASSIYTISVSAADFNESAPRYVEQCPSTMLAAYSSGALQERGISTVDVDGNCTSSFGATSAAAPLAAGIYALVLEANRKLTWRDAQYIGILAADDGPLADSGWQTNGIGRRFSHKFGFGLMDAGAMVRLAELWTTVPPQRKCVSTPIEQPQVLTRGAWRHNLNFDACESSGQTVRFAEHVQLVMSIETPQRGKLNVSLQSPSGTRSRLLTYRPLDQGTSFDRWAFTSVQFWGENPAGQWTVEVFNRNMNDSQLLYLQLVVFGTAVAPVRLSEPIRSARLRAMHRSSTSTSDSLVSPRVDRILALHSASVDRYQGLCHTECADQCFGPTEFDCHRCRNLVVASTYQCVSKCPLCHYPFAAAPNNTVVCQPCSNSCTQPAGCESKRSHFLLLTFLVTVALCLLISGAIATAYHAYLRRKRIRRINLLSRAFSDEVELLQLHEDDDHHHVQLK